MNVSEEQENFIKLARIIIEIIPRHLRALFIHGWGAKFPNQPWANDATSGQCLYNEIPQNVKDNQAQFNNTLHQMILAGDCELWDPSVLLFVLLFVGLNSTDICQPHKQRTRLFTIRKNIDRLRELRNSIFSYAVDMSVLRVNFCSITAEIKGISKDLFGTIAENEVDQVTRSQMEVQLSHDLKSKLVKEMHINYDFHEWIARFDKKNEDTQRELYRRLHNAFTIHCVDENDRIVLKEVDISDFSVELRKYHLWARQTFTIRDKFQNAAFHDETKQYLESRNRSRHIPLRRSELISTHHRVTFIRGIAGIGKSVLAKQLTYRWANGDMYQSFKMCVMFECRDLNYFKGHEGAELGKREILHEFLNNKVNCNLGDGEGVLFIVDGLDELYDINEEDSIIGDLLLGKICFRSKVLVTGRPHIEEKVYHWLSLDWRGVEMTGLPVKQIDMYIDTFSSRKDHKRAVGNAKALASKICLPILSMPQFLNALCCVAVLMKGQVVSNSTELYCWTLYILLRKHTDEQEGKDLGATSQVFRAYSKTLISLSELCYNLLKENRIIFDGNIESALCSTEEEMKFAQSLFVDVTDSCGEKYQFKHLSLMAFLSALHICKKSSKSLKEAIKDNLKKGFIEVASFISRFMSGFSYEGIIKDMLKNVVGLKEAVDEKELLTDIIELLNGYKLDEDEKLCRLPEVITGLSRDDINDKGFIMSIITNICNGLRVSREITSENLCKICKCLESCGWMEEDIRMAFTNVQFGCFMVTNLEQLDFAAVKNFFRIHGHMQLLRMKECVSAVRGRFKATNKNGYCGGVMIWYCKFHGELHEYQSIDRQLPLLDILRCELKTVNDFISVADWGISCETFQLRCLEISIEWWEILVQRIVQRKEKGDFILRTLVITDCTTDMSHELAMKIIQCGVKLKIKQKKKTVPVSSSSPPTVGSSSSTLENACLLPLTTGAKKREAVKARFIFDRDGGSMNDCVLNVSIDVPENSVDDKICLDISTIDISDIPPITLDYGETVLSDVINMKPTGVQFEKPATLTVRHSVFELPELSSIAIKCYDHAKKEWIALPCETDFMRQSSMAISAKISTTSLYVVCMSLESVVYTIPKAGVSFSPFDPKYGVKLIFDDGTFDHESAMVQVKLNIFSKKALGELKRFGLQPFPILHVSETSMQQPKTPVGVLLQWNGKIQEDEKLYILCGDINGNFRDETDITAYDIGQNSICCHLSHFSVWSFVIACKDWTLEKMVTLLRQFSGPCYLVTFSQYYKDWHCGDYSYQVTCCEEHKLDQLDNRMKSRKYYPMDISQAKIYGSTAMRVDLAGCYQINNGPLELTFSQGVCNYTDPFRISPCANEAPDCNDCDLLIFKEYEEQPLKKIPFSVPSKGMIEDPANSTVADAKTVNAYPGSNVIIGEQSSMTIIRGHQKCLGGNNNQEALTYPSPSESQSSEDSAHAEAPVS